MTRTIPIQIIGYLVQNGYKPHEIREMELFEIIDVYTWLVAGEIMKA